MGYAHELTSDQLIEVLAADLEPRMAAPKLLPWLAATLVGGLLVAFIETRIMGVRGNLGDVWNQGPFLVSTLGLLCFLASGLAATHILGLPGQGELLRVMGLAVFVIVAMLATLYEAHFSEGLGVDGGTWTCAVRGVVLGLAAKSGLFVALRRFAPTRLSMVGACAGACGGAFGGLALAFYCPDSHPAHVLLMHIAAPILFQGALGAWLSPRMLRW